jgi:hypothetical protein
MKPFEATPSFAKQFLREHGSMFGSLKFIITKYGLYKFGYEEISDQHFKICHTIQFDGDLKLLFELLQNDLYRLDVWKTAKWQTDSIHPSEQLTNWGANLTSASTLEVQTYESQKRGYHLNLRLLEDHFSRLIVVEFILEKCRPLLRANLKNKVSQSSNTQNPT